MEQILEMLTDKANVNSTPYLRVILLSDGGRGDFKLEGKTAEYC